MNAITLLDGGLGQELMHRAATRPTPLWSTQVMMDNPGLVRDLHRDYFAAGATLATTNTYSVHRDRLAKEGQEDKFAWLHDLALSEAASARDAHGSGRIAGAIGPLVASYRPDIHPDRATAVPLYGEIAAILAPRVDLILCETVVSLNHARAILDGATTSGLPIWIAFSVDDDDGSRLRSGEALSDAARLAADNGASAVLANCSAPEAMPAALDALTAANLPTGAYANAFTRITKDFLKDSPTVDALTARRDMGPDAYADHALKWLDHGATILGGCCETTPAHIAEIARRLRAEGHILT